MRYINQEKVNLKPPESSTSVIRWHQDWAFFPYTNDSLVTVCIAIDDSTKENGKLSDEPFFLNRAEVYTALKISWKCGYSKTELPIKLKYCDQQILFMEEIIRNYVWNDSDQCMFLIKNLIVPLILI